MSSRLAATVRHLQGCAVADVLSQVCKVCLELGVVCFELGAVGRQLCNPALSHLHRPTSAVIPQRGL